MSTLNLLSQAGQLIDYRGDTQQTRSVLPSMVVGKIQQPAFTRNFLLANTEENLEFCRALGGKIVET